MEARATAQVEVNAIVAKNRICTALTKETPPAADHIYKIGEEVWNFSENKKSWIGAVIEGEATGRRVTENSSHATKRQTFKAFPMKP